MVLDRREEVAVGELLQELMEDTGYTPEEFIPGLMVAARALAKRSNAVDQVLDEAVVILEGDDD